MIHEPQHQETHESNQSLWLLVAAPTIWAVHFLASYVTAAVWCEKYFSPDASFGPVRILIAAYTVLALIGIGVIGASGYRRQTFEDSTGPHDFDTPESRHRFLGFATLLLAALSAVATVFVAIAAFFFSDCH